MVAGNEPELTLHMEYHYSKRCTDNCTEPLRQRGSFLGACQPNIRLPSIGKPGVRFWILQSNAKFVFGFHLREILPQGRFQFRNPNPDFMDFLLTVRLGNPKKVCKTVLVKSGLFSLIMRARARPLFLRTVSFNPFSDFPIER